MKKYLYQDLYKLEDKHWWHISKRRIIQYSIENYCKKKNLKILDVGCGTGKNVEELLKYGEIWGLDNSLDAIKFCKKRGLKNLKKGNAEATHLKPKSFHLITLLDVLEHTDDNKTLKEMQRILKRDGLLLITVPAFSSLWSEWDKVLHHKRRYNKKELINIIEKNNFKVIKATYLYSFLLLPAFIIRRIKQRLFRQKEYPSDFQLSNSLINGVMNLISKIEFNITKKVPIPFGTSILVVAKNEE